MIFKRCFNTIFPYDKELYHGDAVHKFPFIHMEAYINNDIDEEVVFIPNESVGKRESNCNCVYVITKLSQSSPPLNTIIWRNVHAYKRYWKNILFHLIIWIWDTKKNAKKTNIPQSKLPISAALRWQTRSETQEPRKNWVFLQSQL